LISSKYTVSITQCSSNINPILGQSIQLESKATGKLTFQVTTNSQLSAENECLISLYDSEGESIDQLKVKFDTTETTHSNPNDPGAVPIDPVNVDPTIFGTTFNFLISLFNCKCGM
jgi:hypothetical protein